MWLAALGGIYGDLEAAHAVLRAIEHDGIQTILHTGDSVGAPDASGAVLDLLDARGVRAVQGPLDRAAASYGRAAKTIRRKHPQWAAHAEAVYNALPSGRIEALKARPKQCALHIEGVDIAVCHMLPGHADGLGADAPEHVLARVRETLNAPLIVCGGPGGPFARWAGGALFVNPGPVGALDHAPARARYAVVSTEEAPWQARLLDIEVPR